MSYSFNGKLAKGEDVTEGLERITRQVRSRLTEGDEATEKQLATVLEVVEHALESGHLGEGPFNVAVSGHANPEFQDRNGYAKESVSISLSRG